MDDGWVWWKADCGVLKVGENKKEEEIGIFVFVLFCFVFCIGGVLVVGWVLVGSYSLFFYTEASLCATLVVTFCSWCYSWDLFFLVLRESGGLLHLLFLLLHGG